MRPQILVSQLALVLIPILLIVRPLLAGDPITLNQFPRTTHHDFREVCGGLLSQIVGSTLVHFQPGDLNLILAVRELLNFPQLSEKQLGSVIKMISLYPVEVSGKELENLIEKVTDLVASYPRLAGLLVMALKNPNLRFQSEGVVMTAALNRISNWSDGMESLKMQACNYTGCGYRCCGFDDNFILMFPGEWERARTAGSDMSLLNVLEQDRYGGRKVRPKTNQCCTYVPAKAELMGKPYKPLDCSSYPLFPVSSEAGGIKWIAGSKCPLIQESQYDRTAARQRIAVEFFWNQVIRDDPRVLPWLREIKMVDYQVYP